MKKDLKKLFKTYYSSKTKPEVVTLDGAHYISINGKGDPSKIEFSDNIQALYSVAYVAKFIAKELNADFVVPKLEAQWWYDEKKYPDLSIETAPKKVSRDEWEYRLLIRMPAEVTPGMIADAKVAAVDKKGIENAASVAHMSAEPLTAVQMLHVGPFDTEPESLLLLKAYMAEHGYERAGLHHEIYLSDFRKTAPEKLKTILREPVRKLG